VNKRKSEVIFVHKNLICNRLTYPVHAKINLWLWVNCAELPIWYRYRYRYSDIGETIVYGRNIFSIYRPTSNVNKTRHHVTCSLCGSVFKKIDPWNFTRCFGRNSKVVQQLTGLEKWLKEGPVGCWTRSRAVVDPVQYWVHQPVLSSCCNLLT